MPQGGNHISRKPREQQAAEDARELIVYADGAEENGPSELARRARVVARETLWLVEALTAERSARQAIQRARDQALHEIMQRGLT